MVIDQNDAEDVLQISFFQIFSKLGEYRFESTIGAWIKRIVVNNCINHLRKNIIHFESIEDKEMLESIYDLLENYRNSKTLNTWDKLTIEQKNKILQAYSESENDENLIPMDKVIKMK